MNKEQENQFKENIKEIARLELKNSFNNNLMETLNSAFIFKYVDTLEKQNQKYKEVIDKIQKHCEIEINASNHYLKNHSSQKELCHKVAHQRILDILKEVE